MLVSAPAGFGKTTLVSEWLRARGLSVAWFSLDEDDSDLARFWSYICQALATIQPDLGQAMASALSSPQPPGSKELAASLANQVLHIPESFVLVLDDYHEITSTLVHGVVESLADNLPPNMILVIASRSDPPWPLARRRSLGSLIEVRARDLRFSIDESIAFLNQTMGLRLASQQVAELERRTEGWIAGLQLAALSMRGQRDVESFVRAFGGSDRFILDYLMEEVLDGSPDDVRRFLIQTSILERMSAELCDAVTGRGDGRAMLSRLDAENAFLIPLDHERGWYRYHHLFADLLQSMAQERMAEDLHDLHFRASQWLESEGMVEEAVSHALRGSHNQRAAEMIEAHGFQFMARGQVQMVSKWVSQLPGTLLRERATLALQRAWLCEANEDPEPWFQIAMDRGKDAAVPSGFPYGSFHEYVTVSRAVLNANRARNRGEPFEKVLDMALEAHDLVDDRDRFFKGYSALIVALAHLNHGSASDAERWLELAERAGRGAPGHLASLIVPGLRGEALWNRGHLTELAESCQRVLRDLIELAERGGESLAWACYVYVQLGRVRLQRNQLAEAESLLIRGVELAQAASEFSPQVDGRRELARIRCAQGRFDEALEQMEQAQSSHERQAGEPGFQSYIQALRVRVWVWRARATGDERWLRQAIRWADALRLAPPDDYSFELQSLAWTRIAQYRVYAEPSLAPLLSLLEDSIAIAERPGGGIGARVETHALKALALDALGRRDEALGSLARALECSQQERFMRHLLDHGQPMADLIHAAIERGVGGRYACELSEALEAELSSPGAARAAAAPSPAPAERIASLVESLTEREMQILRYLRGYLSSTEIAQELYISPNTARFHIKNIYGKLGAHSRRQAVSRARELGLF